MRINAASLALLVSLTAPAVGLANEQASSFDARWPDTPMREATLTERIRLVAAVAKDDIEMVIEAGLGPRLQKTWRCTPESCRLLGSR